MPLGIIASLVGIGGGLNSLFGGDSNNSTTGGSPKTYIPTGQPQTDSYLQQIIQQLTQGGTTAAGNVQNNPYYPQAQSIADQISGYGGGFANNLFQGGTALTNLVGSILPYQTGGASSLYGLTNAITPSQLAGIGGVQGLGQQVAGQQGGYGNLLASLTGQLAGSGTPGISALQSGANSLLQAGMDPQNALYNRTTQQLQDQVRSANSAAGVAGTPYGANLESQALGNFNIDWQNNLLGREASALSGAGSAFGQAGALGTQALGNYQSGLSGAGALAGSGLSSLLSGYTGANALGTSALQNALSGYGGTSSLGLQGLQGLGSAYTGLEGLQTGGLSTLQNTGMLPYQTYAGQQTGTLGALGSLGNISSVLANYLGLGANATGQGLNAQNQNYWQGQNAGSQIGQGLQGLSQLFGGGSAGSGYQASSPFQYQNVMPTSSYIQPYSPLPYA